jgi:hypothetical protein
MSRPAHTYEYVAGSARPFGAEDAPGAAIEFYERLLGNPLTMHHNDDEAAWQLTGGGWLYVL